MGARSCDVARKVFVAFSHSVRLADPSNFNPVGAPLVGLCFTLGGGLFVTRTAYKSHMRKFKGQ